MKDKRTWSPDILLPVTCYAKFKLIPSNTATIIPNLSLILFSLYCESHQRIETHRITFSSHSNEFPISSITFTHY